MNVAVYARKITKANLQYFKDFLQSIENVGWNPIIVEDLHEQLVKKEACTKDYQTFNSYKDFSSGIDLAMSVGGDGTFIDLVSYVRESNVPMIGINAGRLGFLANIPKNSVEMAFNQINAKEFSFQTRSLLEVKTEKNHFADFNHALNEVTVSRKDSSAMIIVHADLNDEYLNSYWADGLIVSTPTGSTAYNLACGGPIIDPESELFAITPIAPHNLNVRPLVIPDHKTITLRVEGRSRQYLLSVDGHSVNLKNGEEVQIKKADFDIKMIKFPSNSFFETIRNKMLWGLDRRNQF